MQKDSRGGARKDANMGWRRETLIPRAVVRFERASYEAERMQMHVDGRSRTR